MTTNLGARMQGEIGSLGFTLGTDEEEKRDEGRVLEALRRHFRPELLNRIDEIICFSPLSRESLEKIAALMLSAVTDRIEGSGVFIEFDESVKRAVADFEYPSEYGARPLRRAITRLVENPYSEALLRGDFSKGDFIRAYFDGESVVFEKKSVNNAPKAQNPIAKKQKI